MKKNKGVNEETVVKYATQAIREEEYAKSCGTHTVEQYHQISDNET